MKLYSSRNYLPFGGTLLLVVSSIVAGSVIGALAYLISNFIYLLIVYPLAVGIIFSLIYNKLLIKFRVRHAVLTGFFGIILGLIIGIVYYGIPYLKIRQEFISNAITEYQVTAIEAENGLNRLLVEKTGSGGFVGYMKIYINEGNEYTHYFVVNQIPIEAFNFNLRSTSFLLYILLELILYAVPSVWIGFSLGKRPFNYSAKDWYEPIPTQIATVSLVNKINIMNAFRVKALQDLCEMMSVEESIHPTIEIYEQQSDNKHADVLLTAKQTKRVDARTVKRTTLCQHEISREEYSYINQKLRVAAVEN
jgi:hypothetical protein